MSITWKVVVVVAALLAFASLSAVGWFGQRWSEVTTSTSAEAVQTRDEALKAARQLAVTLQTLDAARPEQGLDSWQAAATGELLEQLRRDREKNLDQLKKVPSTSSATVVDAALTELDVFGGTATAITALDVRQSTVVNNQTAPPTVRQLRVRLSLNQTDAGWKVASTGLIPA